MLLMSLSINWVLIKMGFIHDAVAMEMFTSTAKTLLAAVGWFRVSFTTEPLGFPCPTYFNMMLTCHKKQLIM